MVVKLALHFAQHAVADEERLRGFGRNHRPLKLGERADRLDQRLYGASRKQRARRQPADCEIAVDRQQCANRHHGDDIEIAEEPGGQLQVAADFCRVLKLLRSPLGQTLEPAQHEWLGADAFQRQQATEQLRQKVCAAARKLLPLLGDAVAALEQHG